MSSRMGHKKRFKAITLKKKQAPHRHDRGPAKIPVEVRAVVPPALLPAVGFASYMASAEAAAKYTEMDVYRCVLNT